MKHFFIVNPASGDGKSHKELIDRIHKVCREKGVDYDVRVTEYPGHAKWLVKSVLANTRDAVRFYACGGDGTVNETSSGLVEMHGGELAVIPVGTGNDFVRSFSTDGSFMSIEEQLGGYAVKIDAVSAGESVFVNILNVGFDSAVVKTISSLRNKNRLMRGRFAYIIGVFINFIKMPKTTLSCTFDDGSVIEGDFLLSAFSNGQYYGGGFKAGALAKLDDGLLDVILVRPCSRPTFLSLVGKYKKGTVLKDKRSDKYIIYKKCKSLKVSFDGDCPVCVDGELVSQRSFDIEVIPNSLSISLPGRKDYK